MRFPRRSLAHVLPFAMIPCLLAAAGDTSVPWPHGAPPSSDALAAAVTGAQELADRERFEEFLEAAEKGEDGEHIQLFQKDIDEGNYGYAELPRLFQFGDSFFGHEFRSDEGYGASVNPQLQRIHDGVYGGRDTFSCAGCHSVGGPDGAGSEAQNAFLAGDGERQSSANVRNAPAVLGLGFVQALGAEMTFDLGLARQEALDLAASTGGDAAILLESKGVSFGSLVAHPDGTLDTSKVVGVDPDLVVKPFGWKGHTASLRRFAEDAARIHFGIQSDVLCEGYEDAPDIPRLGPGPKWFDPDNDGKYHELLEGIVSAAAVYMALLESPVMLPPHDPGLRERWAHGSTLFTEVGCAGCHRPTLQLAFSKWSEYPDTTGGPPVTFNIVNDGEQPRSHLVVGLFSDLKRHDMGKNLADRRDDPSGVPRSVFLTRPLWGLAESPPYLHDGRAATIPAAILEHGGEAQEARDAFEALLPDDQADVTIFLLSLTREPKPKVAR
jgi:mono/diheme cytochrome c family protein